MQKLLLLIFLFMQYSQSFRLSVSSPATMPKALHMAKEKPKSSKFDRIIDDFVGKRYGAGEAWYGTKRSEMSDDEVIEMENKRRPKLEVKDEDLKKNSILIVGDTDSLDAIGDWIAFDMTAKGFNIRVSSPDLTKTVDLFGLPGNNVDILPLTPTSDDESYKKILRDVQALILVGNFNPKLFGGSSNDEYVAVAKRLLSIAKKLNGKEAGEEKIDIKKVALVSRYLTSDLSSEAKTSASPSLLQSVTAFVDSFVDEEPLPSSLGVFDSFREKHREMEDIVRSCGIEYCVIRAPQRVVESRRGATYPVVCRQSVQDEGLGQVATLDLAEAVVQALLIDIDGITFTAEEVSETSPKARPRALRNSYYSILNMGTEDMRSSYMIKPRCHNFTYHYFFFILILLLLFFYTVTYPS